MWEFMVNLLNWIESHVDVSLLDHVDFMQHFALTPLFFTTFIWNLQLQVTFHIRITNKTYDPFII